MAMIAIVMDFASEAERKGGFSPAQAAFNKDDASCYSSHTGCYAEPDIYVMALSCKPGTHISHIHLVCANILQVPRRISTSKHTCKYWRATHKEPNRYVRDIYTRSIACHVLPTEDIGKCLRSRPFQ